MARLDPHQQKFALAKTFEKWSFIFIVISSLISVTLIFLQSPYEKLTLILNAANCVVIAAALVFDQLFNYWFFEAGKVRRLDFIDNSFDTNFTDARSQEYFSNENIAPGIYKMAVNCFENSLFSFKISGKMILRAWIKAAIVIIIFVFSASVGQRAIIVTLFQLSLPMILIQHAIKLRVYNKRMSNVYKSFTRLFNDLKAGNNKQKDPEILRIVFDYQTTLSWGSILLSSEIFDRVNPTLSAEWEAIKSTYKI